MSQQSGLGEQALNKAAERASQPIGCENLEVDIKTDRLN